MPGISEKFHLLSIKFPAESTSKQGIVVTFKAKNSKVFDAVVGGVFINVMNLWRFSRDAADAASPVGEK
jgi:hypothetical protein